MSLLSRGSKVVGLCRGEEEVGKAESCFSSPFFRSFFMESSCSQPAVFHFCGAGDQRDGQQSPREEREHISPFSSVHTRFWWTSLLQTYSLQSEATSYLQPPSSFASSTCLYVRESRVCRVVLSANFRSRQTGHRCASGTLELLRLSPPPPTPTCSEAHR